MITALSDGRVLAEKWGATPPSVIALHGWARSGADFERVVDGLDAVAIHLPGFGITTEPDTAWGTVEYADAVAEALQGLSAAGAATGGGAPAPVVIVGHSFGGRVAVRLAARHPHLVSGLVLTGVPLLRLGAAPKPAVSYRVVRALAKRRVLPQSMLEKARHTHGSADYRAAHGVMRDVMVKVVAEDYRDDLARVAVPTRMVWGELDTSAPADAAIAASTLIPGATFQSVPGAAHLLEGPLEIAVRDALRSLLAEVSS
ncbi:alpha/beta fold hydrolase [Marisediminicola senii]|uniref:alpha/beta fold hydrolase n=1 Tax=Marisediminicola senii TaxID=2711233 RepID=UPI0013EADC94|nr:alpha/beta fold hydrolase [Marisediminicola senii]